MRVPNDVRKIINKDFVISEETLDHISDGECLNCVLITNWISRNVQYIFTWYKFIDFDNVEINNKDNKLDKPSSSSFSKKNSAMNKFVDSITIEEQVG